MMIEAAVTLVTLHGVVLPPPEYDRPYQGELIIRYAEPREVARLCWPARGSRGQMIVQACATIGEGRCLIVFPKDVGVYPAQMLDAMWRHEIAHCNGWRHD